MKKEEKQGIAVWVNLAREAIRSKNKEKIELAIQELQRKQFIFRDSLSKSQRLAADEGRSLIFQAGILNGVIWALIGVTNDMLSTEEEDFLKQKYVIKVLEFFKDGPSKMDFEEYGLEDLRINLGIRKREFHRLCDDMRKRNFLVRVRCGAGYSWCLEEVGTLALKLMSEKSKKK